jgi:hypothetical protein
VRVGAAQEPGPASPTEGGRAVSGSSNDRNFVLTRDSIPYAIWDITRQRSELVEPATFVEPPVWSSTTGTLTAAVTASEGWAYWTVSDAAPQSAFRVLREDGSEVPPDRTWREGDQIVVLDHVGDGQHRYTIVYAPAGAGFGFLPDTLLGWAALGAAAVLGLGGLGWFLRQRARPRLGEALISDPTEALNLTLPLAADDVGASAPLADALASLDAAPQIEVREHRKR